MPNSKVPRASWVTSGLAHLIVAQPHPGILANDYELARPPVTQLGSCTYAIKQCATVLRTVSVLANVATSRPWGGQPKDVGGQPLRGPPRTGQEPLPKHPLAPVLRTGRGRRWDTKRLARTREGQ